MTHRPGPNSAFGVALAAAAALVLGACGTDQPTTPRTTTVTVTPTATPSSTAASSTSTTTKAATDRPPTTYDQAMQHFAAGQVDGGAKTTFTSPTGNIFCSIAPPGRVPIGCEVKDGRITPAAGTGPTDGVVPKDVGRVMYDGDKPTAICNSDSMYEPGAQVLQYGAIVAPNGSAFRCLSEMIGVTCVNTKAKNGFFLAKGVYTIF